MKISIITVCYNAETGIEKTLSSIFSQTYPDIESIVVDGASTDGTLEIIDKYKDKIAKFVSEPDTGIYNAMNKGIKLATGDFVIFMNAGDLFYDENVVEKAAKALSENEDAQILFGNAFVTRQDGSTYLTQYQKITHLADYFDTINLCHQTIFYKKSLFYKYGYFDEKIKMYADWEFNANTILQNCEKTLCIAIPICRFLYGGAAMSEKNRAQTELDRIFIKTKYKNIYGSEKWRTKARKILKKYFNSIYKNSLLRDLIEIKLKNIKLVH